MNRFIVAVSAVALLATGCSTHAGKESESAATSPGSADHGAPKTTGHVGDTLNLTRADGTKVAVTLVEVINPATVLGGAGQSDNTYVAAKLTLVDTDEDAIEGDVNVNLAMVGSDNQTYTPDLHDTAQCTNFELGSFHLKAGESATGCVLFALPIGVSPTRVKYTPSAGFANDFGEWQVTPGTSS